MSHDTDRVAVPTNGRGPHLADAPAAGDAAAEPVVPPASDPAPRTDQAPDVTDPTPAFTPTQLAVGFGIVASLILVIAGRYRRGRKS